MGSSPHDRQALENSILTVMKPLILSALIPIMEFQWIDSLGLWEKWFSLDGTT